MSGFVSEITVFLGITSNDAFTTGFRVITIVLAAIGLVLTPMYLLSMCWRVFFGPRTAALAKLGDMSPRELNILSAGGTHLDDRLRPQLATGLYDATTDGIAAQLHNTMQTALNCVQFLADRPWAGPSCCGNPAEGEGLLTIAITPEAVARCHGCWSNSTELARIETSLEGQGEAVLWTDHAPMQLGERLRWSWGW